jgi:ribonuclease Z
VSHTPFSESKTAGCRDGNRALKEIDIMRDTTVTFLGTSGVVPEDDSDSSSLLIGNKYLFDTGWCAPITMLRYGFSPLDIDYVFMTHFHQDHYLGLVQLLFYAAMNKAKYLERAPFKIAGPAEDIQRVIDLAFAYLQTSKSPAVWDDLTFDIIPLTPGDSIDEKEFSVDTCGTNHAVPGLCYVFTDKQSGKRIAYSGDTGYHASIQGHVDGVDLLIYEASRGEDPIPSGGHSGAPEAAEIARTAQVKELALVHCWNHLIPAALSSAQKIFPNTSFPNPGDAITV